MTIKTTDTPKSTSKMKKTVGEKGYFLNKIS